MKPFNLEEALNGKTVITRDGRTVSQLHYFDISTFELYPIYGVIDGMRNVQTWAKDGTFDVKTGIERQVDLFMA